MDRIDLLPEVVFTPVQQRIFNVLCDGIKHKPQELLNAIDVTADGNNLAWHLNGLRNKIYASGYLVAAHSAGKAGTSSYQLVQRLQISMD